MMRALEGFLGVLVGACLGFFFGVLLGRLIAPAVDPRQKLQHEWYAMAWFTYIFASIVGGSILGGVIGVLASPRTFLGGILGIVLGLAVGFLCWAYGPGGGWDPYNGVAFIAGGFLGGMIGAVVGWGQSPEGRS